MGDKAFRKQLNDAGYKIVNCPKDGNCLYHAILKGVPISCPYQDVDSLRNATASYLEENRSEFKDILMAWFRETRQRTRSASIMSEADIFQKAVADRAYLIRQNGEWAGNLEIGIISRIIGIPILIHQPNNIVIPLGVEQSRDGPVIRVSYHHGNHYNFLRSKDLASRKTVNVHASKKSDLSTSPSSNLESNTGDVKRLAVKLDLAVTAERINNKPFTTTTNHVTSPYFQNSTSCNIPEVSVATNIQISKRDSKQTNPTTRACNKAKEETSSHYFTDDQKLQLLESFNNCIHPTKAVYEQLAVKTNLTIKQVKNWFVYRRWMCNQKSPCLPAHAISELEKIYEIDDYPNMATYQELSVKLDETISNIEKWFIWRRQKDRIQKREMYTFRSKISREQRDKLSSIYQTKRYITSAEKAELAYTTGLSLVQVKNWFYEQHKKERLRNEQAGTQFKYKYTIPQVRVLWENFQPDKKVTEETVKMLTQTTGLTSSQIKGWFKYRQNKYRNAQKASNTTISTSLVQKPRSFKLNLEKFKINAEKVGINSELKTNSDTKDTSQVEKIIRSRADSDTPIKVPILASSSHAINIQSSFSFPTNSESKKDKVAAPQRQSRFYSSELNLQLLERFETCQFPTPAVYRQIAETTNLTHRQIKNWFYQQRCRQKRKPNRFPPSLVQKLENIYAMNPYPSMTVCKKLALNQKKTPLQISKWFSRRRMNDRLKDRDKDAGLSKNDKERS